VSYTCACGHADCGMHSSGIHVGPLPSLRPSDSALPHTTAERKEIPMARGVLDYFPAALAEVAKVSKAGNDKHNPGQEMHHARGKSTDHADCLLRHLVDRGKIDPETGQRHSAQVAWRALALLQQELEDAGAPLARGARLPEEETS
jgi:dATP/dGTP diphosphohydrolase